MWVEFVGGKMRNVFVVRFAVALSIHGANRSTETPYCNFKNISSYN